MSPWRRLALLSLTVAALNTIPAHPSAAQSSEATTVGVEWLGSPPPAAELRVRTPIWQGPGAMFVEQQAAQQTIRSWWPASIGDPDAAAIIDGFAWYLQTHAIEREFDLRYLRTAHSVETRAYLGDHIIWSFPTLRLSRHAAARRDRHAAVFDALERWIGIANLQSAMFEVARLRGDRLTAETIVRTLSDAAGQDLSWAFAAAAPGIEVNYAVTGLTSTQGSDCSSPCVDTTVTVTRDGNGTFAGRSTPRTAEFQSGDALHLKVIFADGTESSARWDGRDQSHQFMFRGPSPATAAYLDPDRIVTLDRNRLDNSIVTPSPTNVPARKWAARWMVWLQHTMLSYGFLA